MSDYDSLNLGQIRIVQDVEDEEEIQHSELQDDDQPSVEVVGAPYTRNSKESSSREVSDFTEEDVISRDKLPVGMQFGTKAVAEELGVTEQTIRNYCREFKDYLDIEETSTGRMKFYKSDIDRLRELLRVKDANNFSIEQLKEYIKDPDHISVVPESQRLDRLVELMKTQVAQTVTSILGEFTASQNLLLESKESAQNKEIELLKQSLGESVELIKSQKELIEKQSKELSEIKEQARTQNEELGTSIKEEIERQLTEVSNIIQQTKDEQVESAEKLSEYESLISQLKAEKEALEAQIQSKNQEIQEKAKEIESTQEKFDKLESSLSSIEEEMKKRKKKFLGIF